MGGIFPSSPQATRWEGSSPPPPNTHAISLPLFCSPYRRTVFSFNLVIEVRTSIGNFSARSFFGDVPGIRFQWLPVRCCPPPSYLYHHLLRSQPLSSQICDLTLFTVFAGQPFPNDVFLFCEADVVVTSLTRWLQKSLGGHSFILLIVLIMSSFCEFLLIL